MIPHVSPTMSLQSPSQSEISKDHPDNGRAESPELSESPLPSSFMPLPMSFMDTAIQTELPKEAPIMPSFNGIDMDKNPSA